jgi:hypothetical protein
MQEWKVERLADDTFEWHSYIGHYYGRSGSPLHTKGAVWMIMRLKDPASIEEEMLYRMGRTGLPGSGNDILETEWNARAVSTFYRFDEMLTQFFS